MSNASRLASLLCISAIAPLQLLAEDKLDVLRYLDESHKWQSLDDQRRCNRCGRLISGRQILVIEQQRTRGKLRLQCPTIGCVSIPGEWIELSASARQTKSSSRHVVFQVNAES